MAAMSNPYDQNPYQQPYGGGAQPHPQGTTVLVLGIVSLFTCFIVGIVALIMGNRVLKEIDANPTAYNNRQNVVVGRILGIVSIVLWGLLVIGYVIIGVIFTGAGFMGSR